MAPSAPFVSTSTANSPASPTWIPTTAATPTSEAASGATSTALIDLSALADNWRQIAALVGPGVETAAVVKADGYGLGLAPVARALAQAGAHSFFIATMGEGLALRALFGPRAAQRLFVLQGLPDDAAVDAALDGALIPVLNTGGDIAAWRAAAARRGRPLPCAIHIDTGMNRLGLDPAQAQALAAPGALDGLDVVLWMSHLACADQSGHPMTLGQHALFNRLLRGLPPAPSSIAASSGIFRGAGLHHAMVRPGAALYGLNPTPEAANPMRPVLRWRARVLQVRAVAADAPVGHDTVGYGAAPLPAGTTHLATLGVGYADGVSRQLGLGRGRVHLTGPERGRGQERAVPATLVGRVSMDLTTVALAPGSDPTGLEGGWADIVGPGLDIDDLAREAGTIGYEILTGLGPRVRRVYQGQDGMDAAG